MRILIAVDFYPPFIGGVERQMQLLARRLAQRGHQVSVATVWHMGLPEREDDHGVDVHRIKGIWTQLPWFYADPHQRRTPPPWPDPRFMWELRRIINEFQPEVVYSYCWIAYSCAAALWGKKIPLILSSADLGYSCTTRNLMHHGQICDGPAFRKCLECASRTMMAPKALVGVCGVLGFRRLLMSKVVTVSCVSRFVQEIIQRDLLDHLPTERGSARRNIDKVWIPPILDFGDDAAPDPTLLEKLPQEPFMLFVGALSAHKGIGPLLSAYQRLDSPPPLVLIGTRWADQPTELPRGVTVLNDVPHGTVMAAWERCLFGLVPSRCADTYPAVVLEAMIKSKAVIGSIAGGIPEMITHGETGLLVPMGDAEALTQAMQRLIADRELCERMGQAGRAWVEANLLSEDPITPAEKLYQHVIESQKAKK